MQISKQLNRGTFVIAVSLVVLAAGAGTARAKDPKLCEFYVPPDPADRVWCVERGPGVTMDFDPGRKPYNTVGTLKVNFTHNDGQAWKVHFRQDFEVPTSGVEGGLRLNLDTTIRNNMTSKWSGYQLQLTDDTWPPPNQPNSDAHPPAPHFHSDALQRAKDKDEDSGAPATPEYTPTFTPFTRAKETLPASAAVLLINDGGANVVEVGQDYMGQNLLVHNRHFAIGIIPDPGRREFTLYGSPIVLAKEQTVQGTGKLPGQCAASLAMTDWSGSGLSPGDTFPTSLFVNVPDGAQLDNVDLTVTLAATSRATLTEPSVDPEHPGDFTLAWTPGVDGGWVGTASLGTIVDSLTAEPVFEIDAGSAEGSMTMTADLDYQCEGQADSIVVSSQVELVEDAVIAEAQ